MRERGKEERENELRKEERKGKDWKHIIRPVMHKRDNDRTGGGEKLKTVLSLQRDNVTMLAVHSRDLRTFLVQKYLHFFGAQVGAALFSHFGFASSWVGAELGVQVIKQARNRVRKFYFLDVRPAQLAETLLMHTAAAHALVILTHNLAHNVHRHTHPNTHTHITHKHILACNKAGSS